jgi:general secretion pathway protein H
MTLRNKAARAPLSPGFTLIEMIVVLVVLGLMLSLVISRGPQHSASLDLRTASEAMAMDLRIARSTAIVQDRPTTFVLDVIRHSYRIDQGPVHALPPAMSLSMLTVSGATLGNELAALRFAPDGSSTGGRITLSLGERRTDILVDWLTGRVKIADAH